MLRTALNRRGEFTVTYELVPGQSCGGRQVDRLLDFAREAKADGRIKALSVTDNPGGNPALAPVAIGTELLEIGIEPLIHFSLKDKSRSQIVSHIYLYQRLGLHSLLVLGGDFPKPGYFGQAQPVFDLDSMQTLRLMREMETGSYPDQTEGGPHPRLFKGCVVSPFKMSEAEQVWQYAKLLHKARAGADFIISQLGFDLRKFGELATFVRQAGLSLPVLANVFVPSLSVAKAMAAGKVPGVLLAKELAERMAQEAATGAGHARLERAAVMIAHLKRCGFQGVHLGGNGLQFDDVRWMLDRFEQLDKEETLPGLEDFPLENAWHFYRLKDSGPSEEPLAPGVRPGTAKLSAFFHRQLFDEQTLTSRMFSRFCLFCAQGKRRTSLLLTAEKAIKRLLFNCRMCGDCTLSRSAYLCPQSGCPKRLINGPCGGSRFGFCEVFPDRRCFWAKVYERLPPHASVKTLSSIPPLPPKDWALEKTSAWINFFARKARRRRM